MAQQIDFGLMTRVSQIAALSARHTDMPALDLAHRVGFAVAHAVKAARCRAEGKEQSWEQIALGDLRTAVGNLGGVLEIDLVRGPLIVFDEERIVLLPTGIYWNGSSWLKAE